MHINEGNVIIEDKHLQRKRAYAHASQSPPKTGRLSCLIVSDD